MTPKHDAARLRTLAEWIALNSEWIERLARRPNDERAPEQRTVTFDDPDRLDRFLTGLRCLAPELRACAAEWTTVSSRRSNLRLVPTPDRAGASGAA